MDFNSRKYFSKSIEESKKQAALTLLCFFDFLEFAIGKTADEKPDRYFVEIDYKGKKQKMVFKIPPSNNNKETIKKFDTLMVPAMAILDARSRETKELINEDKKNAFKDFQSVTTFKFGATKKGREIKLQEEFIFNWEQLEDLTQQLFPKE